MDSRAALKHWSLVLGLTVAGLMPVTNRAYADGDEATAQKLTTLFRSARAVVAQNKDMVEDPKKGPDVDAFLEATKKNYARSAEQKLDDSDEPTKAMVNAIKTVVAKAKCVGHCTAIFGTTTV